MWTTTYIIAQVLTILSYCAIAVTFFTHNKKIILGFNLINSALFLASYLLIGGLGGVIVNAVGMARCITFYVVEEIFKKKEYVSVCIFMVATVALTFIFFKSWIDIFAMFAGVIFTFAIWQKNIAGYRWSVMFCSAFWIIYNSLVMTLFGIIGECCLMVAEIISLILYYTQKRGKQEAVGNDLKNNDEALEEITKTPLKTGEKTGKSGE